MSFLDFRQIIKTVFDAVNSALKTNVTTSVLPTGAATEAKQDDQITKLTSIDSKDFSTETTLAAQSAKLPVSLGQKVRVSSFSITQSEEDQATQDSIDSSLTSIAAEDFATETTLSSINAKLVDGTDIGDVTINNASGANSVNIQDGGNSITVDSEDFDIRTINHIDDSIAIGDGTEIAYVNSSNELQIRDDDANTTLTSLNGKDFATQTTLSAINSKLVNGNDIGDITINNESGVNAVNIQDGGNSITVDSTNLDIRTLSHTTDSIELGDGTNTVEIIDNSLNINNKEGLIISRELISGTSIIHKFGNAPDFDTADGYVTIYDGANDAGINQMLYQYSSSANIDSISSSNNSDTQTIEVQGLDINYDLVIQNVVLTGNTTASLNTSLIRIFRLKNISSTDLAGTVYVYINGASVTLGVPNTSTDVRAIIDIGNNQTLMSIYTVPAGKTAYMRAWYAATAGASKDSSYIIDLYARPYGQVFQLKHRESISDSATSNLKYIYSEPQVFEEKTDIEMRVKMTAVAATEASVSSGFNLILIDD